MFFTIFALNLTDVALCSPNDVIIDRIFFVKRLSDSNYLLILPMLFCFEEKNLLLRYQGYVTPGNYKKAVKPFKIL